MPEQEKSKTSVIVDTSTNGLESEYFEGNGVRPDESVLFVEFTNQPLNFYRFEQPVFTKGTIIDISS
jgi:hypothetical protein